MNFFRFKFACLFYFSFSGVAFSQLIPIQKIDSVFKENNFSLSIQDQISEFDEYLIYRQYNSWTKSHILNFLGSKNGDWSAFSFFVNYKGNSYSEQKDFKIKKKKIKINDQQVKALFSYFDSTNFWNSQKDSLNNNERKINDSITEIIFHTNGIVDQFLISSKQNNYFISVYTVDYVQKELPDNHKLSFILCRNKYISLFKTN